MAWNSTAHAQWPIIEINYQGMVSPDELKRAATRTLELARKNKRNRLLADCSTLTGGHSVTDLYFLADAVGADAVGRTLKEAVLLPATGGPQDIIDFWETTARNHGLQVQTFRDRKAALEWLLQ